MRSVHLYGHLADEIGPVFSLNVDSVGEAVRALEANFPGQVFNAFRTGSYQVVRGKAADDGEALDAAKLTFRYKKGDFHIVPAIEGSGRDTKAIVTTVLGVAILAVSGGSAIAAGGFGAKLGIGELTIGSIFKFGANLLFSGLSSLLAHTPEAKDVEERVESSFIRQRISIGVENAAVPFAYGEILARPMVISSGLSAEVV